MFPGSPAPNEVRIGNKHPWRIFMRPQHTNRLARLHQQCFIVFESSQRAQDGVDVVAHLLRANGYPDGMSEPALADLPGIRIPGTSGSLDQALLARMMDDNAALAQPLPPQFPLLRVLLRLLLLPLVLPPPPQFPPLLFRQHRVYTP